MKLEGPYVGAVSGVDDGRVIKCARKIDVALISSKRIAVDTLVDCKAAALQRHRRGRTAVVLKRSEVELLGGDSELVAGLRGDGHAGLITDYVVTL